MFKEYEYERKIMGTDLSIAIVCNQKELADKIFAEKYEKLQNYESKFSRFLPKSELSTLNKNKKIIASREMTEVINVAKKLYKETGGYFNPLIQIAKYGYDESFEKIKDSKRKISTDKYNIDFDLVEINEKSEIVLRKDQALDFGGFLKGYLAEKIAREIFEMSGEKNVINGVIVNIGGDIYTLGKDSDDKDFVFEIFNPSTKSDDIKMSVSNAAMATSGTYKRIWKIADKEIHHILHGKKLHNPQNDILSVTVITKDGGRADAYTKLFMSVGHKKALEILRNPEIKFLVITKSGEIIKNTL